MSPESAKDCVARHASRLGFSLCGVAPVTVFPELACLRDWIERGYAGQMSYLADPRRASPASVLEGARSLIVCALVYNTDRPLSTEWAAIHGQAQADMPRGWISRYAWGEDYHRVLGEKLERLIAVLRTEITEPFEARAYVDTGPIAERVVAKHAGLGWLGKNTCLIHPELGSWLFLGVIITTLDLTPSLAADESPQPDLCGQCTLCIEACPTGALVAPYQMDARRCISYLTIEHRGSIPEDLRPQVGAHIFGCDICQDVCPFNRKAPVTEMAEFAPRRTEEKGETRKSKSKNRPDAQTAAEPDELFALPLEWLAALSGEEYKVAFRGSAIKRAKYQGVIRNACVALGNAAGDLNPAARARVRSLMERLSASGDPVIAEHAAWALARITAP